MKGIKVQESIKWFTKNKKGQISIFLSIIFIAILIIIGFLIDGARIKTGEAQVRRAVENAGKSVLAEYTSRLKNDYGLFAINSIEKDSINEKVKEYIEMNLLINSGKPINMDIGSNTNTNTNTDIEGKTNFINLYDFRIERISVEPIKNLTKNDTVKKQILEYMKYRVPVDITEKILKQVGLLKDLGEASEIYDKKMDINKKAEGLEKAQINLKEVISGGINSVCSNPSLTEVLLEEKVFIEKFNMNGIRDTFVFRYIELIEDYEDLISNIIRTKKHINQLEEELEKQRKLYKSKIEQDMIKDSLKENETSDGVESIPNVIESLLTQIESSELEYHNIIGDVSKIKQTIDNVYNIIKKDYTECFIEINVKGANCANELRNISQEINFYIKQLEELISSKKDIVDGNIIGEEFTSVIIEELNSLKEVVPDEGALEEMVKIFENNTIALKDAVNSLEQVQNMLDLCFANKINISLNREEILGMLTKINFNYRIAVFDYTLECKDSLIEDPRKTIENAAKTVMKIFGDRGVDLKDEGICMENLPSKNKIQDYYCEENNYNSLDTLIQEVEYEGNLDNLDAEIEFSERSITFSKKAFSFFSSIGRFLSEKLTALRDDIYINEYILMEFKDFVKEKNTTTTQQSKMLERESYFNAEIEYVLHGHSWETMNILKTKGQILLVRFVLNTINNYINQEKNQEAYALATAIVGWFTAGVGIPIVANLILCAWGMGEAIDDLNELVNGKSIPFYRNKEGDVLGDLLDFTYQDYLRLLLLIMNTEKVLGRVEDLIEINIGKENPEFKMGTRCAAIRMEVEISMKYIFFTQTLMPDWAKSRDGRHLFSIVVYEEY